VKLERSVFVIPNLTESDKRAILTVIPKSTQPTAEHKVLDGDTPVTKDRSTSETDKPPRQIHLSVKVVVLSDADAATVSATHLPNWRPAKASTLDVLGTLEFAEMQTLLQFIRSRTQGTMWTARQCLVLDHEEATFDLEGEFRRSWLHVQDSNGARAVPKPPVKLDQVPRIVVIPHVTGPGNGVTLSLAAKAAKPAADTGGDSAEAAKLTAEGRVRDRGAMVFDGGHGRWRGEKMNVLVIITPTVVDFTKRADIAEMVRRARQELGTGFELEETPVETRVFQLAYVRPDQTVYLERNREAGAIIRLGSRSLNCLKTRSPTVGRSWP